MEQITKKEKIYIFLAVFFSSLVILANLLTAKSAWLPFFSEGVPGGLLLYPLTFLISDLVLEIYGKQWARWMVFLGFLMAISSWLLLGLLIIWPEGSAKSTFHLDSLFGFYGASVISSLTAYLIGQTCDLKTYDWIARKTGARYLWLRSGGSTLFSQALDTIIVNGLLFLVFIPQPFNAVLKLMAASYLYKAVIAILMVPIFYLVVRAVKKALGTYGVYQKV